MKRIGTQRSKRFAGFAGDIRLIGWILVAKFPCVVRGYVASKHGDDCEVNVVAHHMQIIDMPH